MPIFKSILLAAAVIAPAIDAHAADQPPPAVAADWRLQDGVTDAAGHERAALAIINDLGPAAADLQAVAADLRKASIPPADARWADLYLRLCLKRREVRLTNLRAKWPAIVFTKHCDLGGSHYAYTEGQSDAQDERHFHPGAGLCVLDLRTGLFPQVRTLSADPAGVIRDPDVSYDGRRILFAWKKSLNADDYHLYEIPAEGGAPRQITSGLGFADYEGAYLPNGDIIFSSTRCVQTVDCWWTEVSNLYTCDAQGRYLRRLGFDQVHTNYPTVAADGRVLYTRWEYNDRGQIYSQQLFQMNPDGARQGAFYGNNSWFPTSILHARNIPGTQKAVAVFAGHHTTQQGQLGILDPARGRQEADGARLIAPVRPTPAVRIDKFGQSGDLFQYPYPLDETEFLVAMRPAGSHGHFAVYWIDRDGRRELLASDPAVSCNQPVPLAARPVPPMPAGNVDYGKTEGTYFVRDVYAGPGLSGVPRGTVKRLRVVSLAFRPAGIGKNFNRGPGGALSSTPVSIGNGAWDPKIVLGEATVHDDGSALFVVPARTPVYFQAVDARGYVVQTMRSWSTLQPGEAASCVGCHESKNSAPANLSKPSLATQRQPERLSGFFGPPRGFSFAREIQPILDRHCTRCHCEERTNKRRDGDASERSFSLLAREVVDTTAKRRWSESYLALTNSVRKDDFQGGAHFSGRSNELVNWIGTQSVPTMLPPHFAGAATSRLMKLLEEGHRGAKLSREELAKIACWIDLLVPYCGDYAEAAAWSEAEQKTYERFLAKRHRMEEIEQANVQELSGKKGRW